MKVSPHFDHREFVPPEIDKKYGDNSVWFINPIIPQIAEFYKKFFYDYYKLKYPNLVGVLIIVNNWHTGGTKKYSGFRTPECTEGAALSQHRFKDAFDCEIILVFPDNVRVEVKYPEIHEIIHAHEELFLANGVTTIESIEVATGWLHTDVRYIPNQTKIFIVKPA